MTTSARAATPPATSHRPRRTTSCRGRNGIVGEAGVVAAWSAVRTSSAVWGRSAACLGQQPRDQLCQGAWHAGAPPLDRHGVFGRMRGDELLRRAAREWWLPGQHLVGDYTQGIQVYPVIGRLVRGCLLRGHVGRRTKRQAYRGEARLARGSGYRLRDAKVGDLSLPFREEDVVRLYVTVDDATAVGVRQGAGHFAEDPHSIRNRQLAFAGDPPAE